MTKKYISLKNSFDHDLMVCFLCNTFIYLVDQIDDLDIRAGLINLDRGSISVFVPD